MSGIVEDSNRLGNGSAGLCMPSFLPAQAKWGNAWGWLHDLSQQHAKAWTPNEGGYAESHR